MPLSEKVQIALSVLQTVGLLIPVVFLALRSYFPDELSYDDSRSANTETVKKAPKPILAGYFVLAFLILSGTLASTVVLFSFDPPTLIGISVIFLMLGLGALLYVFLLLQEDLEMKAI